MSEILDVIHKTIYQFFDACGDDEVPMSDKDKLLLEVNKAICNNLKTLEQEPKWIPVSKRLPEERDWCLAVFKEKDTGYQLIPRVADYIGKGENKWRLIDEDGLVSEYRDLLECVAWMPLPKPYEPQESEDNDADSN